MAAGSEPTELTVTAWSGLALERAQRSGRRRWLSPRRRKRLQLQRGIVALVDPLMAARRNVARRPTVLTGVLLGRPPTGLGTKLAPRRAVRCRGQLAHHQRDGGRHHGEPPRHAESARVQVDALRAFRAGAPGSVERLEGEWWLSS